MSDTESVGQLCEHEDYVEAETTGVLIRRCGKCGATTIAAPGAGDPEPLPPFLINELKSDEVP